MAKRTRVAPLLLLLVVASSTHAQRQGFSGNTCPTSCPDSIRPVCGTNSRVYRNECVLRQAACNSDIRKKNDGPCIASETRNCEKNCGSSYQPVCATNGRTYDNRCQLSIASCRNPDIKERYEGVCDVPAGSSSSNSGPSTVVAAAARPSGQVSSSSSSSSPSSSSSSSSSPAVGGLVIGAPVIPIFPAATQPAPSVPVVNTPRPVRNCPDECLPGFRPVCGSDGQVYPNDCKLRVAICKNPSLRKRNDGVCEKDCSIQCPVEINYVCGTDGKTYINDCELVVARCKDPAISKASNGVCAGFRGDDCRQNCERIYAPVCGSDGRTYHNRCELHNQGCVDGTLLPLHNGECQVQKCRDNCPAILDVVCGTDGVTYPNHCTLINEACKGRSSVTKAADGPCRQNRN